MCWRSRPQLYNLTCLPQVELDKENDYYTRPASPAHTHDPYADDDFARSEVTGAKRNGTDGRSAVQLSKYANIRSAVQLRLSTLK